MKFPLACLMIVLAHSSFGQTPREVWLMFVKNNNDIFRIEEGLKDPILKEKAKRLDQSLYKYNPRSRPSAEWGNIRMASDYFSQLQQDDLVLTSAYVSISGNQDKIDSYDKLGPALDDLYLKVNACLLNNGKAVGSVSVEVHTKKSGLEISNWRVFSIAKILQLYPNFSPTAFPKLSSPTKWNLAPGNYIMWAEDPQTGSKSATQEIPIDKDQECDLAVP
jgi:hypothetical protein